MTKSVNDLLGMDYEVFNKLTERELRKAVQQLSSAANKRLKVFEKTEDFYFAVCFVKESGGEFNTKGKNLNALRSEFTRAKIFLESQKDTLYDRMKFSLWHICNTDLTTDDILKGGVNNG